MLTSLENRIRRTWYHMKDRCEGRRLKDKKGYYDRGIKVEWIHWRDFYNDMANTYKPGLTIDRINNDGNYCKSNCRWATPAQQAVNKSNNRLITFNDKSLTITEWSSLYNINPIVVALRIKRGYSIEMALTMPIKEQLKKYYKRKCAYCGVKFIARVKKARFCTTKHKDKFYNLKQRRINKTLKG